MRESAPPRSRSIKSGLGKSNKATTEQVETNSEMPPVLLLTTLKQERDSLKIALEAELAFRRHTEIEMDGLRARLKASERELFEAKEGRDRMDEEYRCSSQRHLDDHSSSQTRLKEAEAALRKAQFDLQDAHQRTEYLQKDYDNARA